MGHAYICADNIGASVESLPVQRGYCALLVRALQHRLPAERLLTSHQQLDQQVRGHEHIRWQWQRPEVDFRSAQVLLWQLGVRFQHDVGLD